MTILFVNNRIIDSDELVDIITQSNYIHENTLIKMLQCNRVIYQKD